MCRGLTTPTNWWSAWLVDLRFAQWKYASWIQSLCYFVLFWCLLEKIRCIRHRRSSFLSVFSKLSWELFESQYDKEYWMLGPGWTLVGPSPYQACPWLHHCYDMFQNPLAWMSTWAPSSLIQWLQNELSYSLFKQENKQTYSNLSSTHQAFQLGGGALVISRFEHCLSSSLYWFEIWIMTARPHAKWRTLWW